jgi:hypothetical protein
MVQQRTRLIKAIRKCTENTKNNGQPESMEKNKIILE